MKAVRQIAHMIVLNFVFMLTCLPIFTIGASAAALYGVMCRPLDDDPAKRYFQLWKQSFACATKAFLLLAAVGGVVFLTIVFPEVWAHSMRPSFLMCFWAPDSYL